MYENLGMSFLSDLLSVPLEVESQHGKNVPFPCLVTTPNGSLWGGRELRLHLFESV